MIKEIGGYLGLESSSGLKEYYKSLISLNTGRNALVYLFRTRKISKLYIPYYLCDTVSKVCKREKVDFDFYEISESFMPKFDKELKFNEYLYVVNYFGQLTSKQIKSLKNHYKNIIVDNVQAFFTKPIKGIDTIYSCRKFFGVPDGSYLSTDLVLEEKLDTDNSGQRMSHIYGRVNDGASAHYEEFKRNDNSFYALQLKYMSDLTHKLLKNIDYMFIKKRREKNFCILSNYLSKMNKLDVKFNHGPYCYPLLVNNGEFIRNELIKSGIYVPKLWPNTKSKNSKYLADSILPLPCDQRYSKEEMLFIVKEIERCTRI